MGVGTRTDIMHGNMNELEVCWWWRRKVTWRLVAGVGAGEVGLETDLS